MSLRVFLVDDHDVVLRGLTTLIDAEDDLEVVGTSASAAGTLAAIAKVGPDVAVLDVRLGDGNGVEVCRDIRSDHPEVACLILTSFEDDQALVEASLAGAAGYVLKRVQGDELLTAIRLVGAGRRLLAPGTTRLALRRLRESGEAAVEELSPQERRIFDLIGDGLSNREIAEELVIAERTVKIHVANVIAKLGTTNRTAAVVKALDLGLVDR